MHTHTHTHRLVEEQSVALNLKHRDDPAGLTQSTFLTI